MPPIGPDGPISKMMAVIKSWYSDQLPKPETIYLSEYVEKEGVTEGIFTFSNRQSVRLYQKIVDIEKYIQKSENKENDGHKINVETIKIGNSQQTLGR